MDLFFEFEKLDVYQLALDYQLIADEIVSSFPPGRAYLRTQIRKCANSMPSNIAEGTGERGPERARFYRIARREGLESASHLNSCRKLSLSSPELLEKGRRVLHRIVGMMTSLVRRAETEYRASRSEKG
jgi:four helix bundle protein